MRIRWRGVARVAAPVVVALIGLRMLPGLLRAPEPPPLAANVGLPKVKPVKEEAVSVMEKPSRKAQRTRSARGAAMAHRPGKRRRRTPHEVVPDALASTAVMGTRRRHPKAGKPPERAPAVAERAPPPVPESVSPAAPEVVPEPSFVAPPPSSPTPGDGSEEFAPH